MFWEGNPRRTEEEPKRPEKYTSEQIDILTLELKEQEKRLTRWEDTLQKRVAAMRDEFDEGVRLLSEGCDLAASVLDDSPYPAQAKLLRERITACRNQAAKFAPLRERMSRRD